MNDIKDNVFKIFNNLSNNLSNNKKALILSCSKSLNEYSNIKDYIDNDTIIVCIKTSTEVCKNLEIDIDIFFYDNRIYSAHRQDFKYDITDNTLKVICYDFEYEQNKTDIKHDIEISVKNTDYFEFNFDKYEINKNLDNTITINQSGNKYFPIILKAIIFLNYLGIKDYIIIGCDWYNEDLSTQAKHFENKVQDKIGFDNLLGSFYCNSYLTKLINDYNLNIILLSNYSQISTSIIRINNKNIKYIQESNLYYNCKNKINITDNGLYNYLIEYCSKSLYLKKKWYKTFLLMFQTIYLKDLDILNILNYVIIDNKIDPIINLGTLIAMDNIHENRIIIRNNFL